MSREITISVNEYLRLLGSDFELELLNQAGVDNWSGIVEVDYESIREFKKEKMKELGVNEIEKNTELQAKLDKAIEALKFYAGIDNWVCDASVTTSDGKEKYYNSHIIINDDYEEKRKPIGGKRARATLKELGVE